MGETVRLTSRSGDGFVFDAYLAQVSDARRGGLVVLHALWGVTPHIRTLCDGFAEDGYETLAPSLFDRFEPGFPDRDTDPAQLSRRVGWAERTGWGEGALGDVAAAVAALAPPVNLVGFCYGGSAAWLAACRLDGIAAASCFYGGAIFSHRSETLRRPTLLHFGKADHLIPLAEVEAIAQAHPDLPIHLYAAGHAFMAPSDHVPDAARLARLRTLQLFHNASGARGEMG